MQLQAMSFELISSIICFQEISFDVFLQVIWEDSRIKLKNHDIEQNYIELKLEERHKIWVPDLYIRQLREMKVLTLFEETSSLRLYRNSTLVLSLGLANDFNELRKLFFTVNVACVFFSLLLLSNRATIVIKCDMDFVLYPLDVQTCPVDFSSCKF